MTIRAFVGRRRTRIVAMLLVIAMVALLMSCYGKFPLTKSVYKFNGEVSEDKWVKTLVFWGFLILPVYGIAMIGDAIIFNLVEFWTGKELKVGQTVEKNGMEYTLTPSEDGKSLTLIVTKDGSLLSEQRFVRVSDTTCEIRAQDGALSGLIVKDDLGNLNLTSPEGKVLSTLNHEEITIALGM